MSACNARRAGLIFIQLSGEDGTALGLTRMAGLGVISVAANIAPKLCAEFQTATLAGDYNKALEIQDKLMRFAYEFVH